MFLRPHEITYRYKNIIISLCERVIETLFDVHCNVDDVGEKGHDAKRGYK